MTAKYDIFLRKMREADTDPMTKGPFLTEAALNTAHPAGQLGWKAVVGETDTVWIWDVETSVWVNSGASGSQMTDAQVKTAYENNADTNVFTNAEKTKLEVLNPLDKGAYLTEAALIAAHPAGELGWKAVVGETDTIWIWDVETGAWVNSGTSGGGELPVITLGTSGTITIDRSISDKFIVPTPTGAITLADAEFADMKTAIAEINNGRGYVSFPATWRWINKIPTLTDDGTDRIRLSHVLFGATPKIMAEYLFSYLNIPAWNDIDTAVYDVKSFFMTTQGTSIAGFSMNKAQDKFWYISNNNKVITEYNLGTKKDISSAVIGNNFTPSTSQTITGLFIDENSEHIFICEYSGNRILQYTMGTPGDITTAGLAGTYTPPAGGNPRDVWVDDTGTKMFILHDDDTVRSYTMSIANDIATISTDSKSFSMTAQDSTPKGIVFDPAIEKMYMTGTSAAVKSIFQYSMTASGDLDTMSYDILFKNISAEVISPRSLSIPRDGSKIYVLGEDRVIQQYSL